MSESDKVREEIDCDMTKDLKFSLWKKIVEIFYRIL